MYHKIFSLYFILLALFAIGNAKNWVFGYGSMLVAQPSSKSYAARVLGLSRAFNTPGMFSTEAGGGSLNRPFRLSTIYIGAYPNSTDSINGLLFQLTDEEFNLLDQRELLVPYSERLNISVANVAFLYSQSSPMSPNDNVYYYHLNDSTRVSGPGASLLIVQSNVDELLAACLAVDLQYNSSTSFQDEFINTTYGWNVNYWVNDRVLPRRPFKYTPLISQIDAALTRAFNQSLQLDLIPIDNPINLTQFTLTNVSDMNQSIITLQTSVSVLSQDSNNHRTNIAVLQSSYGNLSMQLKQLQNTIPGLQAKVANMSSQISSLQSETAVLLILAIVALCWSGLLMLGIAYYVYTRKKDTYTDLSSKETESIPLTRNYGTVYNNV